MERFRLDEKLAESIMLEQIKKSIKIEDESMLIAGFKMHMVCRVIECPQNRVYYKQYTILHDDKRFAVSPICGDDEFIKSALIDIVAKAIVDRSFLDDLGSMLKGVFAHGVKIGEVYFPKEEWLNV